MHHADIRQEARKKYFLLFQCYDNIILCFDNNFFFFFFFFLMYGTQTFDQKRKALSAIIPQLEKAKLVPLPSESRLCTDLLNYEKHLVCEGGSFVYFSSFFFFLYSFYIFLL